MIENPSSSKSVPQKDGYYLLKQHMPEKVQAVQIDMCADLYANMTMAMNCTRECSHYSSEKYIY